jgi:hypothetical protein
MSPKRKQLRDRWSTTDLMKCFSPVLFRLYGKNFLNEATNRQDLQNLQSQSVKQKRPGPNGPQRRAEP